MAQEKQQTKPGFTSSKYWKMLLVIIMGLLLFGGPYLAYVLINILKVRFLISTLVAFGTVIAGLVLMWYLVKTKVIS
jgi:hypothetical protein